MLKNGETNEKNVIALKRVSDERNSILHTCIGLRKVALG